MRRYALVSAIVGVCLTLPARAQEPDPAPPPGRAAAPSPADIQLLDEVPNYGEILKHQWTDGVPADVTDAEASTTAYGRLLAGPATLTSLTECIGLAVANNTDLQVQRLSPIGRRRPGAADACHLRPHDLRQRQPRPVGDVRPPRF